MINNSELMGSWTLSTIWYSSREYKTMNKVQNPSNSECHTPSSEPFRIYMIYDVPNHISNYFIIYNNNIIGL
jgi:hypothetical protein